MLGRSESLSVLWRLPALVCCDEFCTFLVFFTVEFGRRSGRKLFVFRSFSILTTATAGAGACLALNCVRVLSAHCVVMSSVWTSLPVRQLLVFSKASRYRTDAEKMCVLTGELSVAQ